MALQKSFLMYFDSYTVILLLYGLPGYPSGEVSISWALLDVLKEQISIIPPL